jgi:hypothetical protein
MLDNLISIALHDDSDDARMEAVFWISQFSAEYLKPNESRLQKLSQDSWESIAIHARNALMKTAELEASGAIA